MGTPPQTHRLRRPEATPLYRLLESRYDPVKGAWEDRFEDRYGFWRGMVDGAVARYLDCGIFENGFGRLHCGGCRRDVLVAFSCKGRGLCPSCGAKRGAAAAARLREEVLEAVGHAQWVFTVPKMLRPYFLRHRELLGDLCRAAWDTVREMLAAGAAEEIRPGMVAVVQTFGERVNFHPHVHAIASRGGWRKDGTWVPVAHADPGAAEKVFRHHVLSFLRKRGLIDEERVQLLLSWRHSGFSVHNSVVVEPEDRAAVERLIRYVMRPPVALERLHYDEAAGVAEICPRPGSNDEPGGEPRERVDADELVARVIAQVPDPRRHLIHAYGWYANAARAKRKRDAIRPLEPTAALQAGSELSGAATVASREVSDEAGRRAARRRWADLIRRIYEVDPLVCSNCGGPMKIVAFITDRKTIRAILASMRKSAAPAFPPGSRPPPPPARPAGDAGA